MEFRTSNFSLAVGLHSTNQLRFLNCEPVSDSRVEFVFSDPEHRADDLELSLDRGDLQAPVGAVLASLRYLRRKTTDALREASRGKFQYLYGNSGLPGCWFIELNGNSCKLSHLDGLGYIAKILRYGSLHAEQVIGTEAPPPSFLTGSSLLEAFMPVGKDTDEEGFQAEEADWGYEIGETQQFVGGVSVKRIKGRRRTLPRQQVDRIIEELNVQQRAAFKAEDTKRAEQLRQALIGARCYRSTTFKIGGKQRQFQTGFSRSNDSIRKAIERAIAAIAKTRFPSRRPFQESNSRSARRVVIFGQ